jgi:hypothetical protein
VTRSTLARAAACLALAWGGWMAHAALSPPERAPQPSCEVIERAPEPFPSDLDPRAAADAFVAPAERVGERCPGVELGAVDCAEYPCVVVYVRPAGRGPCERAADQLDVVPTGPPAYVDRAGAAVRLDVDVPMVFRESLLAAAASSSVTQASATLDESLRLRGQVERRVDALIARVEQERGLAPAAE